MSPAGRHIVSFSLYGSNPLYTTGAIENARLCQLTYPGWDVYMYVHPSVSPHIISALQDHGAIVVFMDSQNLDERETIVRCAFWRFLAADLSEATHIIFRDTDSRVSPKEAACVAEWITSDASFHMIYDHPYHCIPMLAGMWGIRAGVIPNMKSLIEKFWQREDERFRTDRNYDQHFLTSVVYPEYVMKTSFIAHGDPVVSPVSKDHGIPLTPFPPYDSFYATGTREQSFIGETIVTPDSLPKPPRILTS